MMSIILAIVFCGAVIVLYGISTDKTGKFKKYTIIPFIIMILCAVLYLRVTKKEPPKKVVLDFSSSSYIGDVDTGELKTSVGELLDVKQNSGTVVVKTKIKENLSNEMTVNQNYVIVGDLIVEHGFNTCNELQYWAVMDLGMEMKVISFTLDKNVIDMVYNSKITYSDIGQYATDLWIAPNLK